MVILRRSQKVRPQQLPGLSSHELDNVVRRAATNSDNSLSSSDSGGRGRYIRTRSRDKQVPVATATGDCKRRQSQLLSFDSADEVRCISDSYPHLRPVPTSYPSQDTTVPPPPAAAATSGDASLTVPTLSVPSTRSNRRRSISLVRATSTFSRTFDDDDAQ